MAADVCRCLGAYLNTNGSPNVTVACDMLGRDEVSTRRIYMVDRRGLKTNRQMKVVSESDLYKLIMRSDKPAA